MTPPQTREELFNAIRQQGADVMDFAVDRGDRREPGKTFSKQALDDVLEQVETFLYARLSAHPMERGHKYLRLTVAVDIDGVSRIAPLNTRPWYIVEGDSRQAGSDATVMTAEDHEAIAKLRARIRGTLIDSPLGESMRRLAPHQRRQAVRAMTQELETIIGDGLAVR